MIDEDKKIETRVCQFKPSEKTKFCVNLDSAIYEFNHYIKTRLLFELYVSPTEVLGKKKRVTQIAEEKGLITKNQLEEINNYLAFRNKLSASNKREVGDPTCKKCDEIINNLKSMKYNIEESAIKAEFKKIINECYSNSGFKIEKESYLKDYSKLKIIPVNEETECEIPELSDVIYYEFHKLNKPKKYLKKKHGRYKNVLFSALEKFILNTVWLSKNINTRQYDSKNDILIIEKD